MRPTIVSGLFALVLLAAFASPSRAENVDLSTAPAREGVRLTIYNSEDLTLVEETRKVSFKKGANGLQFSWANTLIDPTSVRLRFATRPDQLDVLDTTFPHQKPQMLYWNVQSEFDGEALLEISYFTSGLSWAADYLCVADAEETRMNFEGFVRVFNHSGEEYEDARVRLVVGKINLVEKIAQLAQIPASDVSVLAKSRRDEYAHDALRAMTAAPAPMSGPAEAKAEKAKEIVKEGLSEYFIYSIEGTETIANGWSKRMRSFEGQTVPFKIQYRYRLDEYGDHLVRMYLLTNDKESKLGATPLPDGVVRLFRQNGRDGLSFLASQAIKYIPIGDKIELNLGPDPEVIFELVRLRTWRDVIWMQVNGANVFRRADQPDARVEVNSNVVGWDEHQLFSQRVRNYGKKPIELEVRRTLPGHVVFRSSLNAKNFDYQTVQYADSVKPGAKADLYYEVVQSQGRNAKQTNVTVEKAEVAP